MSNRRAKEYVYVFDCESISLYLQKRIEENGRVSQLSYLHDNSQHLNLAPRNQAHQSKFISYRVVKTMLKHLAVGSVSMTSLAVKMSKLIILASKHTTSVLSSRLMLVWRKQKIGNSEGASEDSNKMWAASRLLLNETSN